MVMIPVSILLLVILFGLGYIFYRIVFFPKVFPFEKTLELELENNRLRNYEEFKTWPKEEIKAHSPYGYDLSGWYLPMEGSNKTVILSHGITISRYGSLKYISLFRRHNFNVLVYDNRFHGLSGGTASTFGIFEKFDLKTMVDWAFSRLPPDGIVGTHGESLGSIISLQHAVIDPRISFVIADCSFSSLAEMMKYRLRLEYHLPSFPMIPLVGLVARLLLKIDFSQASPIKDIDKVTTPVFFIHGDMDDYIPPSMSLAMYDRKTTGARKIYFAKGAKHAESIVVDPDEYQRQVDEFLTQVGVI